MYIWTEHNYMNIMKHEYEMPERVFSLPLSPLSVYMHQEQMRQPFTDILINHNCFIQTIYLWLSKNMPKVERKKKYRNASRHNVGNMCNDLLNL